MELPAGTVGGLLPKYAVYRGEDRSTLNADEIKETCTIYIGNIEGWTNLPGGLNTSGCIFESFFLGDIRGLQRVSERGGSRMWTRTYTGTRYTDWGQI